MTTQRPEPSHALPLRQGTCTNCPPMQRRSAAAPAHRMTPSWQAQVPVCGTQTGVSPVQAVALTHVPWDEQVRGVLPTHCVSVGRHSVQAPFTHAPLRQSELALHGPPTPQLPQLR